MGTIPSPPAAAWGGMGAGGPSGSEGLAPFTATAAASSAGATAAAGSSIAAVASASAAGPSAGMGSASAAWEGPVWEGGAALDAPDRVFFLAGAWGSGAAAAAAAVALLLAPSPAGECSSAVEAVFCLRLGEEKGVPGWEGGGEEGSGMALMANSVTAAAVSGLTVCDGLSRRLG